MGQLRRVEQFDLHRREERCDQAVVVGAGDLAHGAINPPRAARESNSQDLYWVPRSECTSVPTGLRRQRAMSRASTTSSVRKRSAIDQPTTRRLNTSSPTAT
jgi:hypothetical protein